jgi:hypothetical protein
MKVLKGIAEIRGAMIGNSKMLVIVGFHSSGYRERWDQTNPASAYSAAFGILLRWACSREKSWGAPALRS